MEVARYWRLNGQRYRLVGEKCPHCDSKIFPPRDICPNLDCGKNTFTFPLVSKAQKRYYEEKGVILDETVKSSRVNIAEILEN